MKKLLRTLSILFSAIPSGACAEPAAAPPACANAKYRQFDFWAGDWNVTQDGKAAGTNRIVRILGGCALLEHWEGASGSRGNSLN